MEQQLYKIIKKILLNQAEDQSTIHDRFFPFLDY